MKPHLKMIPIKDKTISVEYVKKVNCLQRLKYWYYVTILWNIGFCES